MSQTSSWARERELIGEIRASVAYELLRIVDSGQALGTDFIQLGTTKEHDDLTRRLKALRDELKSLRTQHGACVQPGGKEP
jgi:hypothetical protein